MFSKIVSISFILFFIILSCKKQESANQEVKVNKDTTTQVVIDSSVQKNNNSYDFYVKLCGQPNVSEAQPDLKAKLKPLEKIAYEDLQIKKPQNTSKWFIRAGRKEPEVIHLFTGFKFTREDAKIADMEVFFDKEKIELINFSYTIDKDNTLESEYSKEQLEIVSKIAEKDGFSLKNAIKFSNYEKDRNIFMSSVSFQKTPKGMITQYFFKFNFEYINKAEYPGDF